MNDDESDSDVGASGPALLTRAETAARLRCSTAVVSRMLNDGRLRGVKRGGYRQSRVLVEAASVEEHLERTRLHHARCRETLPRRDVEAALVEAEAALSRLRELVTLSAP